MRLQEGGFNTTFAGDAFTAVFLSTAPGRPGPVLERAYHLLQARAANITDDATRCSFLQKVAAHRVIVHTDGEEFEK